MNVVGHWCGMFVHGLYQPDNHIPNHDLLIIDRRGSTHVTMLTQKSCWTVGY